MTLAMGGRRRPGGQLLLQICQLFSAPDTLFSPLHSEKAENKLLGAVSTLTAAAGMGNRTPWRGCLHRVRGMSERVVKGGGGWKALGNQGARGRTRRDKGLQRES